MLNDKQTEALKTLLRGMEQAEESGLLEIVSKCDHCQKIVGPFGDWLKETSMLVAQDMLEDIIQKAEGLGLDTAGLRKAHAKIASINVKGEDNGTRH